MRFRRTVILSLLLCWVAGAALAATSTAKRRRPDRCYAVRVDAVRSSSADAAEKRRRFRRRFSAEDVLDLRVSVWLPAKSDARVVDIKLYTPNGRLYEVLRARADRESNDAPVYRRRRRARVMSARLPVAGSHITGRSLYGKWRAEAFVDGSEKRCARPRRFFIVR